jgi:phage/plasmid-associated DNA primase
MPERVMAMSNDEQYLRERGLKYACTDVGNSERFIAMHGKDLLYIPEAKRGRQWVAWDGKRWIPTHAAMKPAKETARSIYNEARDCDNSTGKGDLTESAYKSQFAHRLRPMVELSADSLNTSIDKFDKDPTMINCRDVIVDLMTGELAKHSPDQVAMKLADVSYTPQAKAPRGD